MKFLINKVSSFKGRLFLLIKLQKWNLFLEQFVTLKSEKSRLEWIKFVCGHFYILVPKLSKYMFYFRAAYRVIPTELNRQVVMTVVREA